MPHNLLLVYDELLAVLQDRQLVRDSIAARPHQHDTNDSDHENYRSGLRAELCVY